MGKIIKKNPKNNKTKSESIKSKSIAPKTEFTFEATGKTKDRFDDAEKVLKSVEATSLLLLRSEWLGKIIHKGKRIFPFLKVIKLKKIEENVVSFFTICIRLFSIATATFLIVASLRGIFNETYSIEPFKVPESFVQDGLDGQEVTSRLLQSVQNIILIAEQEPKINYDFDKEIAKEDVVIMGVSLNSIKQLVRSSIGIQNKTIAGGIVKREKELEISIRVSGLKKSFPPIIVKFEEGKLYKGFDELMGQSAIQILEITEPIVACSYYLNEQKYDKVKSIVKVLLESKSVEEKSYGYLIKGFLLAEEEEYEKAIEQYEKAIKLNPKYTIAYNDSGVVLIKKGDYEGAVKQFKKAIELEPFANAYNNMGIALSYLGDNTGAIEQYKKAIELSPKHAVAHNNMGNALSAIGNNKEASVYFKKAIELHATFEDPYNKLAEKIAYSIKENRSLSNERNNFYEFLELCLTNEIDIDLKSEPFSFY
jgi:tetratricopeptide (TPR) repeat protein